MNVYYSTKFLNIKNPVVTIGLFDGVHQGHTALLRHTIELARLNKTESIVLTFYPHPRIVLNQEPEKLKILTSLNEKIKLIESTGIDNIILLPFTDDFASLTAEKFITDILVNDLKTSLLVVGFNHRFGNGGINFEDLKNISEKSGFDLSFFNRIEIENQYPSSTQIRNLLHRGEIRKANKLLGYNYIIEGKVIEGEKIGRTLTYPTANIVLNEPVKLVPPDGVYACFVKVRGKIYKGMTNIGVCPTVKNKNSERSIEVHILDFNDVIYSEVIELHLVERIRHEIKFSNCTDLKNQIDEDKIKVIRLLDL